MRTREMLYLSVSLLSVFLQPSLSITYNCTSNYQRVPVNADLTVACGTIVITLEINLCTAQWAGFDPANLALNGEHNRSECQGVVDYSKNPPVIRYQLPVNQSLDNPCRQSLQIVDEVPDQSGPFSSFSKIQSVIITGFIDTPASSTGIISYSTDLYYHFSCRYPLEYLLNNTQIVSSSVSVATSDNNGSFIDTLQMSVFNDTNYTYPLAVPASGLQLRTKVYVEVKAINLTGSFNVLLDNCFATPSPYNLSNIVKQNFFTGCNVEQRASVITNGRSKNARFNFEAFRFVVHRDQDRSSLYLHCILRLCEPTKCQDILNACTSSRRRRSVAEFGTESPESATVTLGPIYTQRGTGTETGAVVENPVNLTGLVVGVVFGTAAVVLLVIGSWMVLKKVYWAGGMPRAFN
ncbi:zona pellucida-like domain-containing protein 1 [Aplochiton taeniatus]